MSEASSKADEIYDQLEEESGLSVKGFLKNYDEFERALYAVKDSFKPSELHEHLEDLEGKQASRYLRIIVENDILETWNDPVQFTYSVIEKESSDIEELLDSIEEIAIRYNLEAKN